MNNFIRLAALTASSTAMVAATVTAAGAAPSGDPTRVRTANPAHACAAIPGTLAQFEISPAGFSFSGCVRTLAGRVPNVDFGSPYDQCAALEAGVETPGGFFQITYPYVFHSEPGDPFPDLRAHNRTQCARALYAFHTIESYLGEPPE